MVYKWLRRDTTNQHNSWLACLLIIGSSTISNTLLDYTNKISLKICFCVHDVILNIVSLFLSLRNDKSRLYKGFYRDEVCAQM